MRELVSAVSVGKANDEIVVDLGKLEDNFGQSDMPVAFSSRDKKILLLQMDGLLTKDEIKRALQMAEEATTKIGELQRKAITKFYEEGEGEFVL